MANETTKVETPAEGTDADVELPSTSSPPPALSRPVDTASTNQSNEAAADAEEEEEDDDEEAVEDPQFRAVDKEDRKLFQEVQSLVQKVRLSFSRSIFPIKIRFLFVVPAAVPGEQHPTPAHGQPAAADPLLEEPRPPRVDAPAVSPSNPIGQVPHHHVVLRALPLGVCQIEPPVHLRVLPEVLQDRERLQAPHRKLFN